MPEQDILLALDLIESATNECQLARRSTASGICHVAKRFQKMAYETTQFLTLTLDCIVYVSAQQTGMRSKI